MAVVAHFGTFDVENYGDLLFPAILERRLGNLGFEFAHISPNGGPAVWEDSVATVAADTAPDAVADLAAVIVGGGHIVHASAAAPDLYDRGGASAMIAYPSLWLGAAHLAAHRDVPCCWNAPGVAQPFAPAVSRLAHWAASLADPLAVRDRVSRARLLETGVSSTIHVVPDTAIEVAHLWTREELDAAVASLFAEQDRALPERVVAVHLNRRYTGDDLDGLATRLDRIAQRFDATLILMALGPCHGDDALQRVVGQRMTSAPMVLDQPRGLRQIAGCIARAEAYLGSSLHGMITACAFGTRGMVIVPETAGTFPKFTGFLEQFHLAHWIANSWETAEDRVEALMAAPADPWGRTLEAATPVLDAHWSRIRSQLEPRARRRRRRASGSSHEDPMAQLAASGGISAEPALYLPVIIAQAARAQQQLATAHAQRQQLSQTIADQQRLRDDLTRDLEDAKARLTSHEVTSSEEREHHEALASGLERQRDDLNDRLTQLQAAFSASQSDAAGQTARADAALADLTQMREEVAAQRNAAELANHKSAELRDEIERLRHDTTEDRERERQEHERRQQELRQELAAASAAYEAEQRQHRHTGDISEQRRREAKELRASVRRILAREEKHRESVEAAAFRLDVARELLRTPRGRLSGKQRDLLALTRHEIELAVSDLDRTVQRIEGAQAARQSAGSAEPSATPGPASPGPASPGQPVSASSPPNGHVPDTMATIESARNGRHPDDAATVIGTRPDAAPNLDIVVCVHNALDETQRCLDSIERHTSDGNRVILVDDGSDAACADWLRQYAQGRPGVVLLRNEDPAGYTRAANQGLRHTTADMVILLNSDTIVTPGWADKLTECARSDPAIGIVGPLSNAASYQSVPERFDANGDWAQNPIPPGWDIDQVAAAVDRLSTRAFPRVPFINGFCFAITRSVIEAIGGFDEAAFPDGYGEENDYCLRAAAAGFTAAVADHAYVYHAKSRSYSHDRRRALGKEGRASLKRRYGPETLQVAERQQRDEPNLAAMRHSIGLALQSPPRRDESLSVLFLLPVASGAYGGIHSVVQEAAAMRSLGVDAQVAVQAKHLPRYLENYPGISHPEQLFLSYRTLDELVACAARFSVVVGTIHTSMPLVGAIVAERPSVMPAYYVQDYEPFFHPEGSSAWMEATHSYTLVPNALLFAKTQWLCDGVNALHGVDVQKVSPSLDHSVYFPPQAALERSHVQIAAMIRPITPHRGAERTMKLLRRLAREHGPRIEIQVFGCSAADMKAAGFPTDFRFTNHGVLTREQVAELLRASDIFLDLSDYQAFGRTGLEAMACGCAVVVPALGGTSEYAKHGKNALAVDTSDEQACLNAIRKLITNGDFRDKLRGEAATKAGEYSLQRAALSEINVIKNAQARRDDSQGVSPPRNTISSLAASPSQITSSNQNADGLPEGIARESPGELPSPEWYPSLATLDRISSVRSNCAAIDAAESVDIVVPVFNGPDELEACIESILRNTTIPYRIVVVDDCSTDDRISKLLSGYSALPQITTTRTPENVGFVEAVNTGIRSSSHDVVLLNSDTIVTPRWLQKLRTAAYSDAAIATATPFSNAANAFSVPSAGVNAEPPAHLTVNDMARIVERVSQHHYPHVPTGNGFCMYIKRSAINDIGLFDVERFGRGYGEENDFCMRARAQGWSNVIDDAGFVYHKGSASFGPEKLALMSDHRIELNRLHPEYSALVRGFLDSPLLAKIRSRIAAGINTGGNSPDYKRRRLLFVLHHGGGGVPNTNEDLMRHITDDFECFLLTSTGVNLTLSAWAPGGATELRRWDFEGRWSAEQFHHDAFAAAYWEVLVAYKIDLVHIRHLFKHSFDLPGICRQLGIPVVLSFHDFYFVCPSVHLLDQESKFCAGHCTPGRKQCQIPSPMLSDLPLLKDLVHDWRSQVTAVLENCDAFVTTSESAKEVYLDHFPWLAEKPFPIIEHGRDFPERASKATAPKPTEPIRILVAGNIDNHKGAGFIKSLAGIDHDSRLEFHFLGRVSDDLAEIGEHYGPYRREDFQQLVELVQPSFSGIFSICAETYSHVLTESWAAGIPVLGTSLGAVGERIRRHGGGWIINCQDPLSAYDAILEIANDRRGYEQTVRSVREAPIRSNTEMATDYRCLYCSLLNGPAAGTSARSLEPIIVLAHTSGRGSTFIRIRLPLQHELSASALLPIYLNPGIPIPELNRIVDKYDASALLVQRDALDSRYAIELGAYCRSRGLGLVFDIDDDLLNVSENHPDHAAISSRQEGVAYLAAQADLVTVSSTELATRMGKIATQVQIVRNQLDENLWFGPLQSRTDYQKENDGEIRIGYIGSWDHQDDLEMFMTAFELASTELLRSSGQRLKFFLIGGMRDPSPALARINRPDALRAKKSRQQENPNGRRPPKDVRSSDYQRVTIPQGKNTYPEFVQWIRKSVQWDIAVAPLTQSPLNEAKSELKFLEYAALGIPGIYSDVGAFPEIVIHRKTGMLVLGNDPVDWAQHLIELALDENLRMDIAQNARDYVINHCLLKSNVQSLVSLLKKQADRPIMPEADCAI